MQRAAQLEIAKHQLATEVTKLASESSQRFQKIRRKEKMKMKMEEEILFFFEIDFFSLNIFFPLSRDVSRNEELLQLREFKRENAELLHRYNVILELVGEKEEEIEDLKSDLASCREEMKRVMAGFENKVSK